jgi:hypothetical protein
MTFIATSRLILTKILITIILIIGIPIYGVIASLIMTLQTFQVELPILWKKDNKLANACPFLQRLAGVPIRKRMKKIDRYECKLPLTAQSITDNTPLPDPENPHQIYKKIE